jgi:pyruvate dehydrogenase E1 component alpha subunit
MAKAQTPPKKATGARSANSNSKAALPLDEMLEMHRMMLLIRRFEEKVIELFREGELPGFLHVAIGQEAIAVGVSSVLEKEDSIGSTHRAHGHVLAKGSDPLGMMAELMGRTTGYCKGKGGSMHLADMQHGVVGANGVVGAGAPMMTGVALAQKLKGGKNVAIVYYGDGASNQGAVHEAMNLAQLWKLPIVFVCENNGYAESTPYWQQVPVEDIAVRGKAFDMETISVDGNDLLAVRAAADKAVAHARAGKGPVYLVAVTKRVEGHYVGDPEVYRPKGESKEWRKDDPILKFADVLRTAGATDDQLEALDKEVTELVEHSVTEARNAPLPAPEDAMSDIYSDENYAGPVLGV